MRAKKVIESVQFQRGEDLKKSLGIGMEEALRKFVYRMDPDDPLATPSERPMHRRYWLNSAAEKGRNDLVKYLLSLGFNPDMNDGAPLNLAAIGGHLDVVKTLIEAGADVDNPEFQPFVSAILNDQYEVADYLVQSGARYNKRWEALMDIGKLNSGGYPNIQKEYERGKEAEKYEGVQENMEFKRDQSPLDATGIGRVEERKNAAFADFYEWLSRYNTDVGHVIEQTWDRPHPYIGDYEKERMIFGGLTLDELDVNYRHHEEEAEKARDLIGEIAEFTTWAGEIAVYENPNHFSLHIDQQEIAEEEISDEMTEQGFLKNVLKYFIERWQPDIKIKDPYARKKH